MKEFVFGTDQQYALLKESLKDNLCHVYRCKLPAGCTLPACRIGFEKESDSYALFIDKGICFSGNASNLFKEWLSVGTLRFLDFTDLKEFLRSLKSLYQ